MSVMSVRSPESIFGVQQQTILDHALENWILET